MARVTYHGPRPELVVSMPFPLALIEEDGRVIRTSPVNSLRGPQLVRHLVFLFEAGCTREVPGLFALGLACVRRRPSPWFEVRFHRGEWAEVAWQIPMPPADGEPFRSEDYGGAPPPRTLKDVVPSLALRWSSQQIRDLYEGERKVLIVNGELVWAPPGWQPAPGPPPD